MDTHIIALNLSTIRKRIHNSAQSVQRNKNDINLVAVSKTQGSNKILEAIHAGQRLFGENRVQEAERKWPGIKQAYPDVALHLIGPLQTNKIKQALRLFDVIETLDRPKLAEMLAMEMKKSGRFPECYIQVNIGEEPQKAGIMPSDATDFIGYCQNELQLPVTGLMCIPPVDEAPAPYFSLLASMAKHSHLANISMGMSGDFEMAVAHGATHVRIGQAIFGERVG